MEKNDFIEVLEQKRSKINPPTGRIKERQQYFRNRLPVVFSDDQMAFLERASQEFGLNLGGVIRLAIETMRAALEIEE